MVAVFVGSVAVVVGGREDASTEIRISQWSSGESLGTKVGARGSPMCLSAVFVRESDNGW